MHCVKRGGSYIKKILQKYLNTLSIARDKNDTYISSTRWETRIMLHSSNRLYCEFFLEKSETTESHRFDKPRWKLFRSWFQTPPIKLKNSSVPDIFYSPIRFFIFVVIDKESRNKWNDGNKKMDLTDNEYKIRRREEVLGGKRFCWERWVFRHFWRRKSEERWLNSLVNEGLFLALDKPGWARTMKLGRIY